jgi:hypothetical protein
MRLAAWAFMKAMTAQHPTTAKASLDAELIPYENVFDAKLSALDTAGLNKQYFMDYRLLRSSIKNEIFTYRRMNIFTLKTPCSMQVLWV